MSLQALAGKKKRFIQGAVKHPGAEKAAAKRHGLSTLQEAERESHSSNASIRSRGVLAKRFISGDLSHK
jgi:hypothetical protein